MSADVDLRCPVDPRTLFAKIKTGDAHVTSENVIEVACPTCRANLRKMGERVSLVLHEFNVLGECVSTTRRP